MSGTWAIVRDDGRVYAYVSRHSDVQAAIQQMRRRCPGREFHAALAHRIGAR